MISNEERTEEEKEKAIHLFPRSTLIFDVFDDSEYTEYAKKFSPKNFLSQKEVIDALTDRDEYRPDKIVVKDKFIRFRDNKLNTPILGQVVQINSTIGYRYPVRVNSSLFVDIKTSSGEIIPCSLDRVYRGDYRQINTYDLRQDIKNLLASFVKDLTTADKNELREAYSDFKSRFIVEAQKLGRSKKNNLIKLKFLDESRKHIECVAEFLGFKSENNSNRFYIDPIIVRRYYIPKSDNLRADFKGVNMSDISNSAPSFKDFLVYHFIRNQEIEGVNINLEPNQLTDLLAYREDKISAAIEKIKGFFIYYYTDRTPGGKVLHLGKIAGCRFDPENSYAIDIKRASSHYLTVISEDSNLSQDSNLTAFETRVVDMSSTIYDYDVIPTDEEIKKISLIDTKTQEYCFSELDNLSDSEKYLKVSDFSQPCMDVDAFKDAIDSGASVKELTEKYQNQLVVINRSSYLNFLKSPYLKFFLNFLNEGDMVAKIIGFTTGPIQSLAQSGYLASKKTNLCPIVIAILKDGNKIHLKKIVVTLDAMNPVLNTRYFATLLSRWKILWERIDLNSRLAQIGDHIIIEDFMIDVLDSSSHLLNLKEKIRILLSGYIEFNADGDPVSAKPNQPKMTDDLKNELISLFKKLAAEFDSSYATEIQVCLAKEGHLSQQVNADGTAVDSNVRPNDFARVDQRHATDNPKPSLKKRNKIRFFDAFECATYDGAKEGAQQLNFIQEGAKNNNNNSDDSDNEETVRLSKPRSFYKKTEIHDYRRRKLRAQALHENAELFVRVVDAKEIKQCFGFQYRWDNNSLSTSLLPKFESKVNMRLFIEGSNAICVFLDPERTSLDNYGATYHKNAGTYKDGFMKQSGRRTVDDYAANGYQHMKQLFVDMEARLAEKKSIDAISMKITLASSGSKRWKIDNESSQRRYPGVLQNEVSHNETTFYRGVERELIVAIGAQGNRIDYVTTLTKLILIQALIRQHKNIYLPIFRLDSKRNRLEEIRVTASMLAMLNLLSRVEPQPEVEEISRFDKVIAESNCGLSTADIAAVFSDTTISPNLKWHLDIQLMSVNLEKPTDMITISLTRGDKSELTDIRLIDNMHLLFPANFCTGNQSAHERSAKLEDVDIAAIKANEPLKKIVKAIFYHNFKKMLGVDLNQQKGKRFNTSASMMYDQDEIGNTNSQNDNSNNNKALKKPDFSRILLRVYQSLLCLEFTTRQEFEDLIDEIKEHYSSFEINLNDRNLGKPILDNKATCSDNVHYNAQGRGL